MIRHFRTAPASLKTDAKPAPASTAKTPAQLAAARDMGVMRKPLSQSEQASLNAFENSIANESLDRQRIAKQGGPRAVEAKERAQSLFSENIHRGTK